MHAMLIKGVYIYNKFSFIIKRVLLKWFKVIKVGQEDIYMT